MEKRESTDLLDRPFTGVGFARVHQGDTLVFIVSNLTVSMDYNIVIRYEAAVSLAYSHTKDSKANSSMRSAPKLVHFNVIP